MSKEIKAELGDEVLTKMSTFRKICGCIDRKKYPFPVVCHIDDWSKTAHDQQPSLK
jgi:hypothetical protein